MDTYLYMLVYMNKSEPNCSMVKVFRWHNIFSDGCGEIGDSKTSARPEIVTENAVKSVREKLTENYRRI